MAVAAQQAVGTGAAAQAVVAGAAGQPVGQGTAREAVVTAAAVQVDAVDAVEAGAVGQRVDRAGRAQVDGDGFAAGAQVQPQQIGAAAALQGVGAFDAEALRAQHRRVTAAVAAAHVLPADDEAAVAQVGDAGPQLVAQGAGVDQEFAAQARPVEVEHLAAQGRATLVATGAAAVHPQHHEAHAVQRHRRLVGLLAGGGGVDHERGHHGLATGIDDPGQDAETRCGRCVGRGRRQRLGAAVRPSDQQPAVGQRHHLGQGLHARRQLGRRQRPRCPITVGCETLRPHVPAARRVIVGLLPGDGEPAVGQRCQRRPQGLAQPRHVHRRFGQALAQRIDGAHPHQALAARGHGLVDPGRREAPAGERGQAHAALVAGGVHAQLEGRLHRRALGAEQPGHHVQAVGVGARGLLPCHQQAAVGQAGDGRGALGHRAVAADGHGRAQRQAVGAVQVQAHGARPAGGAAVQREIGVGQRMVAAGQGHSGGRVVAGQLDHATIEQAGQRRGLAELAENAVAHGRGHPHMVERQLHGHAPQHQRAALGLHLLGAQALHAGAGEDDIVPVAAQHGVAAGASRQPVVAGTALDQVVAGAARQAVLARVAHQDVCTVAALGAVVATAADELVIAFATGQAVGQRAAAQGVVAAAGNQMDLLDARQPRQVAGQAAAGGLQVDVQAAVRVAPVDHRQVGAFAAVDHRVAGLVEQPGHDVRAVAPHCHEAAVGAQRGHARGFLAAHGAGVQPQFAAQALAIRVEALRGDAEALGVGGAATVVLPGDDEAAVAQRGHAGVELEAQRAGVDQQFGAHPRAVGAEHLGLDGVVLAIGALVQPGDHLPATGQRGHLRAALVQVGAQVHLHIAAGAAMGRHGGPHHVLL